MISTLADRNLLILTIYFICVAYVLYRATNSVQDRVRIVLEQESLNKKLQEENLPNVLSVQFILAKEYKLDQLNQLMIIIQNKSQTDNIYVDWDRSTLTDLEGRPRRIIRRIPDMTSDVFQTPSAIPGSQTLKEEITTEDVLKRDSNGVLKPSSPLFDIAKLRNGRPDQKKKYSNFMNRSTPLQFSLRLVVRLVDVIDASPQDASPRVNSVPCDFIVEKQTWLEAVSWRPRAHPPLRT